MKVNIAKHIVVSSFLYISVVILIVVVVFTAAAVVVAVVNIFHNLVEQTDRFAVSESDLLLPGPTLVISVDATFLA